MSDNTLYRPLLAVLVAVAVAADGSSGMGEEGPSAAGVVVVVASLSHHHPSVGAVRRLTRLWFDSAERALTSRSSERGGGMSLSMSPTPVLRDRCMYVAANSVRVLRSLSLLSCSLLMHPPSKSGRRLTLSCADKKTMVPSAARRQASSIVALPLCSALTSASAASIDVSLQWPPPPPTFGAAAAAAGGGVWALAWLSAAAGKGR
mmetsp:Transcript_47038/g.117302  ORF Transcript_47038/g.117302 Transcript_47038/m.117302 type:complete len:205 (-) Transcript_47038:153-767(-)